VEDGRVARGHHFDRVEPYLKTALEQERRRGQTSASEQE